MSPCHPTFTPPAGCERYQTVYARQPGSAAAPTAGLHFTLELIQNLQRQGVSFTSLVLHVGLDTFAPVNEDDPRQHRIHTEWCQVSAEAAKPSTRRGGPAGASSPWARPACATLESAARQAPAGETVGPMEGPSDLYILPGV